MNKPKPKAKPSPLPLQCFFLSAVTNCLPRIDVFCTNIHVVCSIITHLISLQHKLVNWVRCAHRLSKMHIDFGNLYNESKSKSKLSNQCVTNVIVVTVAVSGLIIGNSNSCSILRVCNYAIKVGEYRLHESIQYNTEG